MDTAYLLLVDDNEEFRLTLKEFLEDAGHHVMTAANAMRAREAMAQGKFDIAILDVCLPDGSGLDLLKEFKKADSEMGIVLITGSTDIDGPADVLDMGADGFIKKPFELEELQLNIDELLKKTVKQQSHSEINPKATNGGRKDMLIGQSAGIVKIKQTVQMLGDSDSTVLITGESGTGKEVLANLLHCSGTRAKKPFVSINCGAIPEELLESELFGHVKGSFTGAIRSRVGRFEVANGGTIFLDEIGDMSPKLQVKLLRVLQERCFEPVGSHESVHIDVRVIAATHRDLENEIEKGCFRHDLFYRLNVIPVELPALRERGEDILLLIEHFLEKFNHEKSSNISS
ncbi:MAG: sigma-54 dependent transcriptional regulator, partial [Mariprofundaceae bacterium]